MTCIEIKTKKNYTVTVGSGLLTDSKSYGDLPRGKKCVLVSDDNVFPLYGEGVKSALLSAGATQVICFVFPHGEQSKSPKTLFELLEFFAHSELGRRDLAVALGGGVTGDLTGLAASLFMRGIDFLQLPTSLLAMTDSSVGGKTAVDLKAGKNLAGTFYQPSGVICDVSLLDTLPDAYFRDGMAEVIKYGMIYDPSLLELLKTKSFDREAVVSRCVRLKAHCVEKDEYDRGERNKLNFGHTVGHAVELLSDFSVSHGNAVAMGMCAVTKAAQAEGLCKSGCFEELSSVLDIYELPKKCIFDPESVFSAMLHDKKREGDAVNLVVPVCLGEVRLHKMSFEELKSFLRYGM